jgi:hypothetical protein
LEQIVIESDALEAVNMINSNLLVYADICLLIADIIDCLQDMVGSMVFAHRNANVVAHKLSKMALTIVEDYFCMESYMSGAVCQG